jgi:hypothetical protein
VNKFSDEYNYEKRDLEIMNFEAYRGNDTNIYYEGKSSLRLHPDLIYSPDIRLKYKQLTKKDHAWIRAIAMVYIPKNSKGPKFSMIFNFEHKNKAYAFTGFDAEHMKLNIGQWNKIQVDYLTPEVRSVNDILKVFLYHRGNDSLWIDNFKVEVFEQKETIN